MLRVYMDKVMMAAISGLAFFLVLSQSHIATSADIRKFCAPQTPSSGLPQLFLVSNISSQQAALQRNATLQEGKAFFSRKEGESLFHTSQMASGDCVLVNLQELMHLTPIEGEPASGASVIQNRGMRVRFLPAVFFSYKNDAKHFGLIAEQTLQRLRSVKKRKETATATMLRTKTDPALFLIYIICPANRKNPCELTVKQNGRWLLDKKTGRQLRLPVLARSVKNSRGDKEEKGTKRLRINHDTPQGIYTIWGAVTGGGTSPWFQTARIDLDAALPPINAQPYPINSFLLSNILPEEALDDYWVNEWPLAYSLGRIALRIAPGDFSSELHPTGQGASLQGGSTDFNPTHGCINTGEQQEEVLQILVDAGVFETKDIVIFPGDTGKRWAGSPKLGKAFVILKDRDEYDDSMVR